MTYPIVSIITPLYNRLNLVPETWTSIQAQTFMHWEWIVVDDGSTDDGPQFIQQQANQDKRIKLFFRTTGTKGPSACRNLGVQQASGKYLLFLDSDDIITPNCLEKRVEYLENNPELDFAVFTQALFTNNINENTLFSKFFASKTEYVKAFIADQHPWQTSGPLWRKDSFKKTDGFREDYTIMEDPELHIRALLMKLKFEVIQDEPDFFYRQTPKTKVQEEWFWQASIKGRIVFYKNLVSHLEHLGKINCYKQSLNNGIKLLFKGFLLARLTNFKNEFNELYAWACKKRLLSPRSFLIIKLYYFVHQNKLLSSIPFLRGVLFKLM